MSLFTAIKRFWIRKILGRVYDTSEIFENLIPIENMNKAELKLTVSILYNTVYEIQQDIRQVVRYIGEAAIQCDKCSNYDGEYSVCYKCEGSGVVRNKQLFDWPWEN